MLLINTSNGEVNIINCILGQQSDVQLSMVGSIHIDIDLLLEKFNNSDLPLRMVITKTDDEYRMAHLIEKNVTGDSSFLTDLNEEVFDSYVEEIESESDQPVNNDPRGQYAEDIICPLCKTKGVYLKENKPALCVDCLKIEYGLGNFDVEEEIKDE